mgnify:CR=1 FL=1
MVRRFSVSCSRLTQGDHDLAKEALQHTYLRIAKYVRPCETQPQFKAWLRIVTRTALHDCWRKRQSFFDLFSVNNKNRSHFLNLILMSV